MFSDGGIGVAAPYVHSVSCFQPQQKNGPLSGREARRLAHESSEQSCSDRRRRFAHCRALLNVV